MEKKESYSRLTTPTCVSFTSNGSGGLAGLVAGIATNICGRVVRCEGTLAREHATTYRSRWLSVLEL